MKRKSLVNTLLNLRLTYYRAGILERLRRFKVLIFFVLAMVVPTISVILNVVQSVSMGLIDGIGHSAYFTVLIIFQLFNMIWVGSQHDYLKITDVENYLKTLKISDKVSPGRTR